MTKLSSLLAISILSVTITVSVNDFKPAFGKWEGTITYLDYTSGKPFTMPCNITLTKDNTNDHQLILALDYPQEKKANGNDTLVISSDGTMIDGATVVSRKKEDDVLIITTDKNGIDGNDDKKAILRHIYTIGRKTFSIRKEVKFDGEDKWIMRNEYKMGR